MATYSELRASIQKRIDALPIYFAFSDEQFKEAMNKLGLTENDTDSVCKVPYGGFCLKTDAEIIKRTFHETSEEMDNALKDDDFCADAIEWELENHEFCYNEDAPEEALEALGLCFDDERVRKLLKKAKKTYWQKCIEQGWLD